MNIETYQEGLGAADGTLTFLERLGSLLYKLAESCLGALKSYLGRRNAIEELKRGLGEWRKEALDPRGRWLQPHLTRAAFAEHLVKNDGVLTPPANHDCTAYFGWARFLYALDISPGRGLVAWSNPPKGKDPAVTGVVSLQVDDEIFCHITNLYQLYTTQCVIKHPFTNVQTYTFPFGARLDAVHDDKQDVGYCFRFTDSGTATLDKEKRPFAYEMTDNVGFHKGFLRRQEGLVMERYEEALSLGISPAELKIVDANESLEKRVDSLLQSMKAIGQRSRQDPCLVTPKWLEEASRVKRRLTTDGGGSSSLVEWIVKCIDKDASLKDRLVATLPPDKKGSLDSVAGSYLRELCLFNDHSFEFHWSAGRDMFPTGEVGFFKDALSKELPGILGLMSSGTEGSWERTLVNTVPVEKILKIMWLPRKIMNAAAIVIQSRPSDPVVVRDNAGPSSVRRPYEILP